MAEATVPVKRKKTLFMVIGAVVILFAVAAAAAFLLIRNRQLASDEGGYAWDNSATEQKADPAHAAKADGPGSSGHVFSNLDMFTANLADGDRDRFAQVGIAVELSDAKAEAEFKAIVPIVRSETLMLLTSKSANELLSLQGKQALARQILEIARKYIAANYRNSVYAVYFSSFVIQ